MHWQPNTERMMPEIKPLTKQGVFSMLALDHSCSKYCNLIGPEQVL